MKIEDLDQETLTSMERLYDKLAGENHWLWKEKNRLERELKAITPKEAPND